MEDKQIQIKRNVWKIIFYFACAVTLLFLGVINLYFHEFNLKLDSLFIHLASVFLLGLSSTLLISIFYEVIHWKSALIINKDGILDNSGIESVGLIEWEDIIGIEPVEIMSTNCLLIETDKPEKYLKKAKNPLVTFFMRLSIKKYGTPIKISVITLKCTINELEEMIKTAYEKYK